MTLWGESLPVVYSEGVDTTTIRYRAGSATIAGAWDLWSTPGMSWVTDPGDPVTLSWVVEVVGGSGTLTASEGMASALGVVPSLTSLGSHAASTGQLEIPSTLTAADLFGSSERPFLRLSGTGVTIQQVKLRVWPDPLPGGWSAPYQAETDERTAEVLTAGAAIPGAPTGIFTITAPGAGDGQDNLTAVQILLRDGFTDATVGAVTEVPGTGGLAAEARFGAAGFQEIASPGNNYATAAAGAGVAWFVRDAPPISNYEPPGVYGVDWVEPPDEVAGDPDGSWLVDDPEAESFEWAQGTVTVEMLTRAGGDRADETAAGSFHVGTSSVAGASDEGDPFGPLVGGSGASFIHTTPPSQTGTFDLPEPTTQVLRVSVWHDGHLAEQSPIYTTLAGYDYASAGDSGLSLFSGLWDGEDVTPVTYLYTPPPFRYWTLATVAPPMRLMQRGDGLGMGSGSLLGVSTRQGSSRLLGSY